MNDLAQECNELNEELQSERAARIEAENTLEFGKRFTDTLADELKETKKRLEELEDENRKLIRYGTFIFNRVNFSIGRAKSKIADKAVLSCMQKIAEISKARSKS